MYQNELYVPESHEIPDPDGLGLIPVVYPEGEHDDR